MKVAVCDDEAIFVDRICALLERWAQKRNLCLSLYRFSDGDALLKTHLSEVMDLIFLDVRMPFIDGMDAARELRAAGSSVPIIFISSAREYAVDSYKVDAFWYLVKPVDETLLYTVLDKFHRTFHEKKEMVVLLNFLIHLFRTLLCYILLFHILVNFLKKIYYYFHPF